MSAELTVGGGANLLFGFRPWNATSTSAQSVVFAPPKTATTEQNPNMVSEDDKWKGAPFVSVHADAASLVSALYGHEVVLGAGQQGSVRAGPLVLHDTDAAATAATLGKYLGVSLKAGLGYMLVRLNRIQGRRHHPLPQGGRIRSRISPPRPVERRGRCRRCGRVRRPPWSRPRSTWTSSPPMGRTSCRR